MATRTIKALRHRFLPIISTVASILSGIALLIADAVGACGNVCMAPPSDAQRFAAAVLIGGPLILWGLWGRLRERMPTKAKRLGCDTRTWDEIDLGAYYEDEEGDNA